jgi:hypothetical protein
MIQSALRSILLADATVTGLVSTRVDWGWRPQGSALPALTLNTVSDPRPKMMSGAQLTRETIVQIDAWGLTYASVRNAANAAIAALTAQDKDSIRFLGFFVDSDRDLTEQTDSGQVFRVSVDVRVIHTIP